MERDIAVKSPFVLTDQEIEKRLGETLETIAALRDEYCALKVSGVDDEAGYDAVHSAKMDMVHRRNDVKKNGLAERKDANDFCASVLRIEKRLYAEMSPIEDHLIGQEKIVTDEKARIKAEADAKEAARIQARIGLLCSFGAAFNGQAYYAFGLQISAELVKVGTEEFFEKFIVQLREAQEAANKKIAEEAEAQRIEKERLAKIAVEQKVEADRLADIQAAQDKQAAELKEKQDAIDAEKKRIADEEAARLKSIADAQALDVAKREAAEKARIETEQRIKREAEEKAKVEAKAKADAEKKAARAPDKEKLLAFAGKFEEPNNPKMATTEGQEILNIFNQKIEDALSDLRERVKAL